MAIRLDKLGNVFESVEDCLGRRCGLRPCVCGKLIAVKNQPGGVTLGQIEEEKLSREVDKWMERFEF